ncbi:MAG: putative inorganic carbon transporter subunit DabA [Polyangiales bacterium]
MSDGGPAAERRDRLRAAIARGSHLLPAQGPLSVFIHHNTLHAFESLRFADALREAASALDVEVLLPEAEYRAALAAGRIEPDDLEVAVDSAVREKWLPAPWRDAALAAVTYGLPEHDAARVRWEITERDALPDRALWALCVDLAAEHPPESRVDAPAMSAREALRAATGEDPAALVDGVVARVCAAWLDEGMAHWPMPRDPAGMYASWRALALASPEPPDWRAGLKALLAAAPTAEAMVLDVLDALGATEAEWEGAIQAALLELPGWAGMVHRLETTPTDRAPDAPAASTLDYLALRLCLTRLALTHLARASGYRGPLSGLRAFALERVTDRAPSREDLALTRAWRLFHLALGLGLDAASLRATRPRARRALVAAADGLDGAARRRILHDAYEVHHRDEVLGALRANLARPLSLRAVARPRLQVVTCIDDREESLRRHLEEADPELETFGAVGFFGLAVAYRGLDDGGHAPHCPPALSPSHRADERAVDGHAASAAARAARRRSLASVSHALRFGSRTLGRGFVLAPLMGAAALAGLALRVLAPRWSRRLRERAMARLLPTPETELRSDALSADEAGARVADALRAMGMVDRFAPLVVVLGHGSRGVNNPHQSAYECGACGGRGGGANARLFAALANDPAVRARGDARGAHPRGDALRRGYHDSADDAVTLFDLGRVPEAHREALARARAAIEVARGRTAQERCAASSGAPRGLGGGGPAPRRGARGGPERGAARARPRHQRGVRGGAGRSREGCSSTARALLVSYDPEADVDGAVLARSLAGAVPVCAGINLEYFFSRVDNERLGAGTKLPHNLVSLLGVMDGAVSDLKTGLPRQMVEIHEPVRLLLVVEARAEHLRRALDHSSVVRGLVERGWVRLARVDPASGELSVGSAEPLVPWSPRGPEPPRAASSAAWHRGRDGFLPPALIEVGHGHAHP